MISPLTRVLISTLVSSHITSNYSLKDDPCSKFDSCLARPHLRTCSCDSDCLLYGTCCYNYKRGHQNVPLYSCYSRHTTTPVLVKRSCPDDFRGDIDFKNACLDDDEDEMDVKNTLLVTSNETKVTYWNKQCAKCNNEQAENLVYWNIEVLCPKRKNVDGRLIRRNLTFDHYKKRWGLEVDGEFLLCVVKYAPPPHTAKAKPCSPNLISSCPDNYIDDEETAMKCSKSYAERKLKVADVYFKNVHCALCNGLAVTDLECSGRFKPEDNIVEDSDFRKIIERNRTVEVVFTEGRWFDREEAKSFECSKGFSYDRFRTRCRKIHSLSKVESSIPNSSAYYRTNRLAALTILFALIYSY